MFLTEEQRAAMLAMHRQELIDFLCKTGYITALPEKQQGICLFGRTKNERAVCLAWGDNNDGCVTLDAYRDAYREIVGAGLKVPFLFFGRTSLCTQSDVFTFAQLPWCFEQRSNPVLRILQQMNMRANLHVPTRSKGESITSSEAERLVGYAINAVLQSLAHVFGEGHVVSGIEVTRTAEGFTVEVDLLDLATQTEWETEIFLKPDVPESQSS